MTSKPHPAIAEGGRDRDGKSAVKKGGVTAQKDRAAATRALSHAFSCCYSERFPDVRHHTGAADYNFSGRMYLIWTWEAFTHWGVTVNFFAVSKPGWPGVDRHRCRSRTMLVRASHLHCFHRISATGLSEGLIRVRRKCFGGMQLQRAWIATAVLLPGATLAYCSTVVFASIGRGTRAPAIQWFSARGAGCLRRCSPAA